MLKGLSKRFNGLFNYLKGKIRTSGVIPCEFNSIKFKMLNRCDDGLVDFFYYGYKYKEDADLKLFMKLAESSNCILDIGANTGLYSILSAKKNINARIFAFEPHRTNAARMKINLQLNNISNVRIIEEAVGDDIGELSFSIPSDNSITDVSSANFEFSKKIYSNIKWDTVNVPLNTIDNFRRSIDYKIDLIKCDVETFEVEVFNGMRGVLKSDRPVIIFECFLDENRIAYFNKILSEFDYYVYLILEQGIVYSREGFQESNFGLNYLITPIKPNRTFINYNDSDFSTAII